VFVVPTDDLEATLAFYREGIGLELVERWEEPGRGAILRGSWESEVELVEANHVAPAAEPRTTLGLQVAPQDVDAIYERLVAAGAHVKAAPRGRAWGMRGFGAFDPSGTPVNVYAPATADDEPGSSR